jgi:outer membrane receptor for ferrienterochelin and colicins
MKKNSSNKFFLIYVSMFLSILSYSQNSHDQLNKEKDIEEIVVTGQYYQQSVDKSIYQVEVISQEDIKNRAASNISDILSYYLNFITIPNSKNGDSEVSLFGLNGQYFKVLIDNIPIVSDYGMGSNVDLTKINLDHVERIEIVRGSMGTVYQYYYS